MGCCVRLQGCSEVETAIQQAPFAVIDEKRKIQLESGAGHMAVRTLAKNYRFGLEGFPEDKLLARAWYLSNVLQGDATSALFLAVDYFGDQGFGKAWAYADIFMKTSQDKDL